MNIDICTDCVLAHVGYSEDEIGSHYDYKPLSLFYPTYCDTFYVGSSEAKRWVLDSVDCCTTTDGYESGYCPGHFSAISCQGCGNNLAGLRFCYTATRVGARVEA